MSLEPYVSYGCKLCWFSKLDALEADLSGTGLKHWGLNVGFKPFIALGETLDSKLLLAVGHCNGNGVPGKIVYQTLPQILMTDFSLHLIYMSHSVFRSFSRESCSILPANFICLWREISLRSSYTIFLNRYFKCIFKDDAES